MSMRDFHKFCNNFKDPGVQHYSSQLFTETRERLDEVFIALPAPKSNRSASEVNMSRFMNLRGGCFLGKSKVHVPGQKFMRADCLKKGDFVLTGSGQIDQIECVVETVFHADQKVTLCVVNENLITTPWHPVKMETGEWKFPAEFAKFCFERSETSVYSFLLKLRGTILIGNAECATLAHGLQGNVIGHSFFGSEAVARDLMRFRSYDSGTNF